MTREKQDGCQGHSFATREGGRERGSEGEGGRERERWRERRRPNLGTHPCLLKWMHEKKNIMMSFKNGNYYKCKCVHFVIKLCTITDIAPADLKLGHVTIMKLLIAKLLSIANCSTDE